MKNLTFAAVMMGGAALVASPALAQDAAATGAAETQADPSASAPAATELTPEEQNAAITAFNEGGAAQEAGNHAAALAKFKEALPTVRRMVAAQPDNLQMAGFLATTLSKAANSEIALNNTEGAYAFFDEAVPQWRKVYRADQSAAGVRDTLLGFLVDLGNSRLLKEDVIGAQPYFQEALPLAREAYETEPESAKVGNALLASLVGMNQVTQDATLLDEAKVVATELQAKGMVSAANRPVVDAILASG